ERTSAIAVVAAPDRVVRPSVATAAIPAHAASPVQPEAIGPLTWIPSYVDRVPRPTLAAAQHQVLALWPFPISTPALTQLNAGFVVAPEAIVRPAFAAARQQPTPIGPVT